MKVFDFIPNIFPAVIIVALLQPLLPEGIRIVISGVLAVYYAAFAGYVLLPILKDILQDRK